VSALYSPTPLILFKSLIDRCFNSFKFTIDLSNSFAISKLTLKAAFELGERMHSGSVDDKIQINNPKDAADFMMGKMEHLTQEKFIALFLNSKNIIIKQKTIRLKDGYEGQ
jgi:DNA repair protein RadC